MEVVSRADLRQAMHGVALIGMLVVSFPGRAFADPGASASFRQAIDAYEQFNDARASELLKVVLSGNPPREVAAKAHLYLGLIAFNGLHLDKANAEFKLAIRANPTLDVPLDTSPKAALAFGQAREEVAHEISNSVVLAPKPEAVLPTAAVPPEAVVAPVPSAPEPEHRAHVLSFVLGGAAVALGVVAVVGGVQVLSYNATVGNVNKGSPDGANASSVLSEQSAANFWRIAWIPFAAGAAVAAGAGVLTW